MAEVQGLKASAGRTSLTGSSRHREAALHPQGSQSSLGQDCRAEHTGPTRPGCHQQQLQAMAGLTPENKISSGSTGGTGLNPLSERTSLQSSQFGTSLHCKQIFGLLTTVKTAQQTYSVAYNMWGCKRKWFLFQNGDMSSWDLKNSDNLFLQSGFSHIQLCSEFWKATVMFQEYWIVYKHLFFAHFWVEPEFHNDFCAENVCILLDFSSDLRA